MRIAALLLLCSCATLRGEGDYTGDAKTVTVEERAQLHMIMGTGWAQHLTATVSNPFVFSVRVDVDCGWHGEYTVDLGPRKTQILNLGERKHVQNTCAIRSWSYRVR